MSNLKATPRAILRGIQDLSRRKLVVEAEQLPQHLPLIYLLTERGPTLPQVAIGDSFAQLYGSNSLDLRSKYATHATVLANTIMANGNSCMIQRIKPAGATTALLRLSLEMIPEELPVYERNADGSIKYDALGQPIQETNVSDELVFTIGQRLVWHVGVSAYTGAAKEFGKGVKNATYRLSTYTPVGADPLSSLDDGDGGAIDSTLWPILDLEVVDFGDHGNRKGIRLAAPNADDLSPGDVATMNAIGAYLYRITCVERPEDSITPNIIETVSGEMFLDLALKDGVVNPLTGAQLSMTDVFLDAYEQLDDPSIVPIYGPFGRMHLYRTNLEEVLETLIEGGIEVNSNFTTTAGEKTWDTTAATYGRTTDIQFTNKPANRPLLNIFTGIDQNGVPYWSFDVSKSVVYDGVAFGDNNVHYATGGDDGLVFDINGKPDFLANTSILDEAVGNETANFGSLEAKMLDDAKYPFSTLWDSGFSLATKRKMLTLVSKRKDVNVFLATQSVADYTGVNLAGTGTVVIDHPEQLDVGSVRLTDDTIVTLATGDIALTPAGRYLVNISGTGYTLTPFVEQDQNNATDENNMAVALRTAAAVYPESEIYGTPVCRVVIVGRSGRLINSQYRRILPLTIDVADKVSKYMGAGTGRWASGQAFDESPNNQVSLFRDINITWQNEATYNRDWDNGLVWVQNFDRRRQFYPAYQTVYPDDTSVLNSAITMMACCELEKVSQRVWRELTGRSNLTRDQFIDRSNALIQEKVRDRFDGRFVIQPETFFTEADNARGYSWGTKIHIYANNMVTVGSFTVVAHRMEDLAQA